MRKETVPIDMASEQKTILGIFSRRQLIYLIAGGALIYSYIPFVFNLIPNPIIGIFLCLISVVPVVAAAIILAFFKKKKLHLNYDQYLLIKIGYKNQIGIWRKGSKPKDWMVNQ